ncbi:MAG TPA: alpha/beta hydrolase [Candidatus Dormibacteraeota bacterium]|nr:alpha/beta hydrolase [Candidatus Dormibacteraeota bacterium]
MSFTTADGRRLSYRKLGHGPVLVCHPGGPGLSSIYLGDLAGLWERFTLVILNPRGTDGSDRPADPAAYRLDDYVSDLEELRRHLRLERMLLFGYSHGGIVAQAYTLAHPDHVHKLVLACTAPRFGPEQEAATTAAKEKRSGQPWYAEAIAAADAETDGMTDEERREAFFRMMPLYFAHFGPAEAGYLDTFRSESINGDASRVFAQEVPSLDLRPRLAELIVPTLVITGEEDFICGPVCAEEISAAIPGARKVIVGDAGHMVFMEQPQAFHDEVVDFLEP